MRIIDSHCHLDYEPLSADVAGVLRQAKQSGVVHMLTICTKLSKFDGVLAIAESNSEISCTIGIHPHHAAEEHWPGADAIVKRCAHPKIVGIGEAGLDYHYDFAPKSVQHALFREHIAVARTTGLPLVIHTREADDDTAAILKDESEKGAFPFLLHCFTAGKALAETGIKLGGYVSFSGILTYKKAQDLRDIARDLPPDRILVETDSPYLAPEPFRGKSNVPAYVTHTLQKLAEVKGVSVESMAQQTTENFQKLFRKAKV